MTILTMLKAFFRFAQVPALPTPFVRLGQVERLTGHDSNGDETDGSPIAGNQRRMTKGTPLR
jgi:hypothetical protein